MGLATGGAVVTISGTNLADAQEVDFGGVPGTSLVVNDDGTLTVISPAHTAGLVDVQVRNQTGTSATTPADDFLYVSSSLITQVVSRPVMVGRAPAMVTGTWTSSVLPPTS